ncbi:hypothetical protein T265_05924 [Opisthorchis viverrini]|uniref:Uncharacterized protein n=1 Tax=Opisthorchis viverrini TaxID=6198 RepID=A0A074ZU70_OPIVI|nr:hypothetical protein T265_05924 [Opisthorchis viverrini]KER26945.1 hypothetical protein T265_05924 [Opisthorchis viverrini]
MNAIEGAIGPCLIMSLTIDVARLGVPIQEDGPAFGTDDSVDPAPVLCSTSSHHMAPTSSGISQSIFKPRHPVYLAVFNGRTLRQTGQQATLALTLNSLGIDVCCVSWLTASGVSTHFELRTSGDAEAAAVGCTGVGIVLSHRAEVSLLYCMPVDGRLCTVRLATSAKGPQKQEVDQCLLIVSTCASTDCSCDAVKDRSCDALNALMWWAKYQGSW